MHAFTNLCQRRCDSDISHLVTGIFFFILATVLLSPHLHLFCRQFPLTQAAEAVGHPVGANEIEQQVCANRAIILLVCYGSRH